MRSRKIQEQGEIGRQGNGIVGSSAMVTLMSTARVGLGLLSQMLIAFYFGTSRQLDIYFIVFACPSIVLGVVLALFGSSMIPVLTRVKDTPEELETSVSTLFVYVVVISLALGLGGMALGKALLGGMTGLTGAELEFGGSLAGLMWLVTGLEAMNSFLAALYHLKKRFFLPAALNNFSVIGTIGGAVFLAGSMGVKGLVAGWLVMDLLSLAMLSRALFRDYRFSLGKIRIADPHALGALRNFAPIAVTIMPFTVLPSIDAYFASGLPAGSMSFLGYSTRVVVIISVLVTSGIYTVLLPYLSENVKDNDTDAFMSNLRSSLKVVLAVVVPIALFCYFYREQLVSVFLKRGVFDARSVAGVSEVLPLYLLGLVAMCLSTLVNRAHVARGGYGRLCLVSVLMVCFYFVSAGVFSHRFSCQGIAMAYASYWSLFFTATALLIGRPLINRGFLLFGARTAVNSLAAVGLSYALSLYMPFHTLTVLTLCFIFTGALLIVLNRRTLRETAAAA